jgi:two-component system, OmpR family, sensor kinase
VPGDGVRGLRTVRGLLAGVPLRVRLAAVACCAVAAGAAVMGLACSQAARSALMWQADQQLRAYADQLTGRPFTAMPAGPGPGGAASGAFVIEVVSGHQLVIETGADGRSGPVLAGIAVRAGQLAVVRAKSGGGRWLVVAEPVRYRAQRILFTYGSDGYFLHVTSTSRPGTDGTLVVGLDLRRVSAAITKITVSVVAVSVAAVLVIAFAGLAVIGAILRPLARAETMAAGVGAHGVARQVTSDHPGSARAGACRELRRPVSVVRGCAEYYRLRGPLTAAELDRLMSRIADEAARIDAIIDDLAGAGRYQPRPAGSAESTQEDRL